MTRQKKDLSPAQTASPLRTLILNAPPLSPEKKAQRELGRQRLKERLSQTPYHRERAARFDGDYWAMLHNSCIEG
jgi:hypothetical protein